MNGGNLKQALCIAGLLAFLTTYAFAARLMLSIIGPSNSTSNVTLSAGAAGVKNCLTDIDVTSDNAFTFRILDGGTTVYQVPISSGGALVRSWSELTAYCGSAATSMTLSVSAGNMNINYSGFTGQ